MINDVLLQVKEIKKEVAIAICGPEGELISFHRMDGASPAAARIAHNKAYTAARDRKDTRLIGQFRWNMIVPRPSGEIKVLRGLEVG